MTASRTVDVRAGLADPSELGPVVAHLAAGGLAVHPTETVYGFGGLATPEAVVVLRALKGLQSLTPYNPDQKAGVDIVRRAIQVPARQIVQNAGEDGSLVVGKLFAPIPGERLIELARQLARLLDQS